LCGFCELTGQLKEFLVEPLDGIGASTECCTTGLKVIDRTI
jgi:hypothetical protein